MLPMPVSATTTKFRSGSRHAGGNLPVNPRSLRRKADGGGFGGACVALVESGKAGVIASEAIDRYQRAGYREGRLVPEVKVTS